MPKKPKILFIADKWSCGNKNYGLSAWDLGMQNSLKATGLADADVFHMDDYFLTTGLRGDAALLQKIGEYRPDIIYLITNQMPGTAFDILDWPTLDKIKNDFKIPMVAVWGDLQTSKQGEISKRFFPYTTLSVALAATAALKRINRPDKYTFMWVPRDPRIFNNPNKTRDIDVGYFGSPRKGRLGYVLYLIRHGIKTIYGGGEAAEHLTTEQYADRYQRSKIALSFSRAGATHVINARPFEAIPCGAMLLEQESFETMKFFTPYVDYVPYSSKRDMLKKAKYYLEHDEEREKIARSGQKKAEELYSAKRFWQIVIDKTLGTNSGEVDTLNYAIPEESLSRLSPFTTFKMKFLNSLCSTYIGFTIFRMFNWGYWKEIIFEIWHDIFLVPISKIKPILQKRMSKGAFEFVLRIKRKIIKN